MPQPQLGNISNNHKDDIASALDWYRYLLVT